MGRIATWLGFGGGLNSRDLKVIDDEQVRRAIAEEVDTHLERQRRYRVVFALVTVAVWAVAILLILLTALVSRFQRMGALAHAVPLVLIGAAVGPFLVQRALFHRRAQRLLRELLIERGILVCVHCGYDLRGQTEPRCPECGRAFDPELLRESTGAANDRRSS